MNLKSKRHAYLFFIPKELFLRSNLISNFILFQTLPSRKKEKGYIAKQ